MTKMPLNQGSRRGQRRVSDGARGLARAMGIVNEAGNLAFKVFTAGLGVATVYLTATFSVNVYRGLAWHNEQKKLEKGGASEQPDGQPK